MKEFLDFAFMDFIHFIGVIILIYAICEGLSMVFGAIFRRGAK